MYLKDLLERCYEIIEQSILYGCYRVTSVMEIGDDTYDISIDVDGVYFRFRVAAFDLSFIDGLIEPYFKEPQKVINELHWDAEQTIMEVKN